MLERTYSSGVEQILCMQNALASVSRWGREKGVSKMWWLSKATANTTDHFKNTLVLIKT